MSPRKYMQQLSLSDGLRIAELVILVATISWGASEVRVIAASLQTIAQDVKEIRQNSEQNTRDIEKVDSRVDVLDALRRERNRIPPEGGAPGRVRGSTTPH